MATPRRASQSSDLSMDVRPEDVCSAGGIHDFEKQWICIDYVSACFCCPCYLLRECFCGWWSRNVADDDFGGIGCRPSGEKKCSKCRKTEREAREAFARERTAAAANPAPSYPQLPPLPYTIVQQMTPSYTEPPPMYSPPATHGQNELNLPPK